jgi:hypothetical protein
MVRNAHQPEPLDEGDGTMKTSDIDGVLQTFRRDLPNTSKTAQAIDRGARLDEISECAEEEGVHQLAAILFEAQQEEGQPRDEQPATLEQVVRERLATFREDLPDGSETAKAIDRKAPLGEISERAQAEGLNELAAVLFEAQQEHARA